MSKERLSDELALMMVRMRSNGITPTDIGRVIGKKSQFVSTAINRVRRADQNESGEGENAVNVKYW